MKLLKLSLAAALAVTVAYAGEKSDLGVSANVAMTSNYVWRGMTQTNDSPAIQGGFDLDYKGLYVGVWGSNIKSNKASVEIDAYLGYTNDIAGLTYDLGYIQYMYPKDSDNLNFGEVYASLSYDFKVVEVSAMYYVGVDTNDVDTATGANWEPENGYEMGISIPLPKNISIDATYGDYDTLGAYYLVGANISLGKYDFSLAYTANDGGKAGSTAEQDNIVATISSGF